ncbi:pyridoxal phosphate-dependent transferase [Penicillium lividum]|nr:pyridoxal phosphate-dependent transferase [Penicillium lividum]
MLRQLRFRVHARRSPFTGPHAEPIGVTHPPGDIHSLSVSLPTWNSIVAYQQKEPWIVDKVPFGYPRFYIHGSVKRLGQLVLNRLHIHAHQEMNCLMFPSDAGARRCAAGLKEMDHDAQVEIAQFSLPQEEQGLEDMPWLGFHAVIFPKSLDGEALVQWRDAGTGVCSRHAEYCIQNFDYLRSESINPAWYTKAENSFGSQQPRPVITSGEEEKMAVRQLISKLAASDLPGQKALSHKDVYLFPNGMNAIGTASRALASLEPDQEVVGYGWLYVETGRVIRGSRWGKTTFYHAGSKEELDNLEKSMESGRQIKALFCDFPGNTHLSSPDLHRIRELADKYNFIVACDDSVCTFINTDIFPWVDIRMTSLTKMFSGSCNVAAGSIVVNPQSRHYDAIHRSIKAIYEDILFPLDAAELSRSCQDVVERIHLSNKNALPVVRLLASHPSVAQVNHPSLGPTAHLYERHRRHPHGGYGQVLAIVFHTPESAACFYDALDVRKGSSFGANFTLAIPFAQVAHPHELDFAESHGVPKHIVRISVGLEEEENIVRVVARALKAVDILMVEEQEFPSFMKAIA